MGFGSLMLLTAGCGWAYNHSDVLVLTSVNVPAGGGSAEVMFEGLAGERVQISLAGELTTMQPYGSLLGPDGSQTTTPPIAGATNGFNSAQVTISQTGTYQLNVLDNSKRGGAVTVRVELTTQPA